MAATDLLTLPEARAAVRLPSGDTSKDADLQAIYIPAVTPIVEDVIGAVVKRSVVCTRDGGGCSVALPFAIDTITSIVDNGVALAASDYTLDKPAGLVFRGSSTAPTCFAAGRSSVVVTFVAGIAADTNSVPAHVKLAARLILAATYRPDQQGARPDFGQAGESATTRTPSGFDIPRAAYAYLEPAAAGAMPGFA